MLPKDLPIHVPDVIARDVGPMLRELDTDPLIRRAVHAGHQAFDDEPGAQIEAPDPRQRARVKILAIIGNALGH